jgi:hypothetical protein
MVLKVFVRTVVIMSLARVADTRTNAAVRKLYGICSFPAAVLGQVTVEMSLAGSKTKMSVSRG